MNVLFAYRFCGLGGVETALINRCEALRRRGVQASVLFGEFYGVGAPSLPDRPWIHAAPNEAKTHQLLGTMLDVICLVDYPEFLPQALRGPSRPLLLMETHASNPVALPHLYRNSRHPRVAAIVVPSEYNAALVHSSGSGGKPVHVLPNALDTGAFFPRSAAALGERFKDPSGKPIILWVGRLEHEKNPAGLLALAEDLSRVRQDVHFICVGDSPEDPAYRERFARELAAAANGRATLLRTVPQLEMPYLYSLAGASGGCFVSTSRHESVPMTILEAMACRCPVASSAVGGVGELVDDGSTGVIFPLTRAAAMAAVLRLVDPAGARERAAMVDAAQRAVQQRHSLREIGRRCDELLHEIVKVHGPPGYTRRRTAAERSLVSAIIPVYNRPAELREAVNSVLNQTHTNVDVIIVDDGSTDETGAVCDELASMDARVRVLHRAHTGRAGLGRQAGLEVAHGEYIQFLDSDDLIMPRKFEVMVAALQTDRECDIAYCYTRRYPAGSTPPSVAAARTRDTHRRMLPEFLGFRFWYTSTPLYTRRICELAGAWSEFPVLEDMEYDMRMAARDVRLSHCRLFLTDIRDLSGPRLSPAGFWRDPQRVRWVPRAYEAIYLHSRRGGMTYDDPNMKRFVGKLLWVADRCADLGLDEEHSMCRSLARDAFRTVAVGVRMVTTAAD